MSSSESRVASIRIGVGAGTADDRIYPAVQLAQHGELDYLVFECLAERTVARENLARSKDPERGYTPRMLERIEAVLPACLRNDVRIVTNMGAANPRAGARAIRRLARDIGAGDVPCAVVSGDDVSDLVRAMPGLELLETGAPLESILTRMASANAYLGADVVAKALATGARIVITGRVSDPSLFLGPAMHEFGWSYNDWPRLAAGVVAGHLLECSAQVNGGCFADPGKREVKDLATLGYPFADVAADGGVTIGKLDINGGRVDVATCTEQLLYEIHDPSSYITPDCVVAITDVRLEQVAQDRAAVRGAKGRPRTQTYKVTIGYFDGYIGEGQVSYGGPNAVARAKLGAEIVQARLKERGFTYPEMQVDLIGYSSVHGELASRPEPYEVRLRIAARADSRRAAEAVGFETRALHMHGPAGGGGGSDPTVREILAVQSVLLQRELVTPEIALEGNA
jgi:hypothetical protein